MIEVHRLVVISWSPGRGIRTPGGSWKALLDPRYSFKKESIAILVNGSATGSATGRFLLKWGDKSAQKKVVQICTRDSTDIKGAASLHSLQLLLEEK